MNQEWAASPPKHACPRESSPSLAFVFLHSDHKKSFCVLCAMPPCHRDLSIWISQVAQMRAAMGGRCCGLCRGHGGLRGESSLPLLGDCRTGKGKMSTGQDKNRKSTFYKAWRTSEPLGRNSKNKHRPCLHLQLWMLGPAGT